jgi:integrase
MSDRIKGQGSWRKRDDGRYEYAVPTGKTRSGNTRRTSFYGRTKKEALAKYERWRKAQLIGDPLEPSTSTLEDFFAQHLEHLEKVQGKISSLTRNDYAAQFRRHISPVLGQVRLRDLKPTDIANWQGSLIAKNLGPRSLEYTHRILKAALEFASRLKLITGNPAADVPAPKKVKPEKQSYTKDEARAYLTAASGLRLGALFLLVLTTGIRRSEVLGLRWQDLDPETLEIHIRQRIRWKPGGGFDVDVPKTARSRRSIPISGEVMNALEQLREDQSLQCAHVLEQWQEYGLIFTARNGNPLHSATLAAMHEAIIVRAGIKRLTFHELRHSFTSLARAAGVDPKAISDILGHHSVAFTMDFYQHLFEDQRREVARSAEELTGARLKEPVELTEERWKLWQKYINWLEGQPDQAAYPSKTPKRYRELLERGNTREREYVGLIGEVIGAGWKLHRDHLERLAELETVLAAKRDQKNPAVNLRSTPENDEEKP